MNGSMFLSWLSEFEMLLVGQTKYVTRTTDIILFGQIITSMIFGKSLFIKLFILASQKCNFVTFFVFFFLGSQGFQSLQIPYQEIFCS